MKHRILIIDDDEGVRFTLKRALEGRGDIDVRCANDGKEGLLSLEAERADLVITDIIMPDKEGIETIMEIKHLYPSTSIIAISGGGSIASRDLLTMARDLGASYVITKPFLIDELLSTVDLGLGVERAQ